MQMQPGRLAVIVGGGAARPHLFGEMQNAPVKTDGSTHCCVTGSPWRHDCMRHNQPAFGICSDSGRRSTFPPSVSFNLSVPLSPLFGGKLIWVVILPSSCLAILIIGNRQFGFKNDVMVEGCVLRWRCSHGGLLAQAECVHSPAAAWTLGKSLSAPCQSCLRLFDSFFLFCASHCSFSSCCIFMCRLPAATGQ